MKIPCPYAKPLAVAVTLAGLNLSVAEASTLDGRIGGTAYLTYDQATWSTMRSESYRTDVHGMYINPTESEPEGHIYPTSDTDGNRYFYPQLFVGNDVPAQIRDYSEATDRAIAAGTSTPEAVDQWRILDPAQRVPVVQPSGGWALPIDSLQPGLDAGWAPGYTPSSYNPNPGPYDKYGTFISLGGSLRMASDFRAPGGVIWARGLDLREEVHDYGSAWFIGASAYAGANGTFFQLIHPVFGVDPDTGLMTLEADYTWGDSALGNFFGFLTQYHTPDGEAILDRDLVLGHISINPGVVPAPAAVPLPSAAWLFGSALLGLLGLKRRPTVA